MTATTHESARHAAGETTAPPEPRPLFSLTGNMASSLALPSEIHQRMIAALVTDAHIRQFVDVGIEQPGRKPTHAAAAFADEGCRTLYLDRAPLDDTALGHFTPKSCRTFVRGWPDALPAILAGRTPGFDWTQPTAVCLFGVMPFYDQEACIDLLSAIRDKLAPGSFLAFTQSTPALPDAVPDWTRPGAPALYGRNDRITHALVNRARFTTVEPGVVAADLWHPRLPRPTELRDGATLVTGLATVPR